jgi:uncharacterized protein (DUF1810 family)
MTDAYDLQRFVHAQDRDRTYQQALSELRTGRKHSHWMWFVFPQIAGLGHSANAQRYAVSGEVEAKAYLEHAVLGARLRECSQALLDTGETDPAAVLGGIDAQKLRSSMTLFASVAPQDPIFEAVLDRFFDGSPDEATTQRLSRSRQ